MRIAIVVYEGVLDDECDAFASVLGLLDRTRVDRVGAQRGHVSGPGGGQTIDVAFDEIASADVVVIPGGLGCERIAEDPVTRDFLHRMASEARYLAASSTGSVVLAAAGLLAGRPAATHWLAKDLLRRYGGDADERRMVISGNVITCEGRLSAVDAAFSLVERLAGHDEVVRIKDELFRHGEPLLNEPTRVARLVDWLAERPLGRRSPGAATLPAGGPVGGSDDWVTPLSVMVELVDDPATVRRMRRRANRHHSR